MNESISPPPPSIDLSGLLAPPGGGSYCLCVNLEETVGRTFVFEAEGSDCSGILMNIKHMLSFITGLKAGDDKSPPACRRLAQLPGQVMWLTHNKTPADLTARQLG